MPTTFNVFFLGNTGTFRIDPTEGNTTVENAAGLEGSLIGTTNDPLLNRIVRFSPGTDGFGRGNQTAYDTNNNAVGGGERFRIDGGPNQTFDASAVYNSTLTYTDGTTASVTAVVFQDNAGNVYLAPEVDANSDQAAFEAKPIRSIRLNTVTSNPFVSTGLTGNRQAGNFAVCFTRGTRLLTPRGYVAIDALRPGDLLTTADNGSRPVAWIGSTRVSAARLGDAPNMRPIRLRRGHHGLMRDILVSPQHCVAVGDNFVRARHLAEIAGSGARVARGVAQVDYIHVLCERHEVLIAEGMRTESFYPGPMAVQALGPLALAGLECIVPGVSGGKRVAAPIGPTARPVLRRSDVRGVSRHEDLLALA